jgi:hypothetical protein
VWGGVGMPPKKEPIIFEVDGFITQGKICTKCNTLKPFKDYYKNKQKTDGYNSSCKECKKEADKKFYLDNQEVIANRVKNHFHKKMKDEQFVLSERKRAKRKREKYGEQYRKKARERYKNDLEYREKKTAVDKKWRSNNKDRDVISSAKRRALKKKLPCNVYRKEWDEILDEFKRSCALTGTNADITLEHFIPLSTGHGGHIIGNVYPITSYLNLSKSVHNPFDWIDREDVLQEVNIEMWNNLINSLASKNGLTVGDFKEYVNWCFSNKRKIENITSETSSLSLWLNDKKAKEE